MQRHGVDTAARAVAQELAVPVQRRVRALAAQPCAAVGHGWADEAAASGFELWPEGGGLCGRHVGLIGVVGLVEAEQPLAGAGEGGGERE